jgi:hypothetical protein
MKTFLMMLILGTATLSTQLLYAQSPEYQPLRIRIGQEDANKSEWMYLVSTSVGSSLAKHCGTKCIVVESGNEDDTRTVDAYLRGTVATMQRCWECSPYIEGAMRLVANDGTVLWSDIVRSSFMTRNMTSSFADNVAKKLVSHLASKPLPAAGK